MFKNRFFLQQLILMLLPPINDYHYHILWVNYLLLEPHNQLTPTNEYYQIIIAKSLVFK